MDWSAVRILLVIANVFVAVTAIGGGLAMATGVDPLPKEWLSGTPFETFVLPGMLLATVVGGSATTGGYGMVSSPDAGALCSVVAGVLLVGWITAEILLLNQPSWTWTEAFYLAMGVLIAALGILHGWS